MRLRHAWNSISVILEPGERPGDGINGMWNILGDQPPVADLKALSVTPSNVLPLFGSTQDDSQFGWHELALCAQTDPEAFFPEKGGSTREAKKVCSVCEVRVECLQYALAKDERFGIWGGLSERERRKLKRRAV